MREIKFRGQRIDNGELVIGCLTRYSDEISYITVDVINNEVYQVSTKSVCQFTEIKDKFGKDIYENDAIEFNDDPGWELPYVYKIYWHEDYLQWWVDGESQFDHCALYELDPDYIELVEHD